MRLGQVLSFFSLVLASSVAADSSDDNFVVELKANSADERSIIANIIHIDSVFDDRIYSVVNSHEMSILEEQFSSIILSAERLSEDTEPSDYFSALINTTDFPIKDSAFHNYEEMTELLKKLVDRHPTLASLASIGKSIDGRDLWALKIGNNTEDGEKPAIAYMGTHHAREHVSTEMPIMLAEELLAAYDADNNIHKLLDDTDIYIIPMVNPDGATHDISGKKYKWWRKNRRLNHDGSYGVDLNRNYGYGFGTGGSSNDPTSEVYMGTQAFSEPETSAIRDFFKNNTNIKIALSFHTYSELILYPWGGKNTGIGGEDERIFKKMANTMAMMNKYEPMQSSELYIASGDTCDWLYGELGIYCFTFELSPANMFGGGFYPGASVIEPVFNANLAPMLYLANLAKNPRAVLRR